MKQASSCRVAVIGIGNDLAGDDGAGLEVIRLLEPAWQNDGRVLLYRLEGDLLAVADLLPLASEFVFVDAVAGKVAGELIRGAKVQRAYAPSFHQTDIALVMQSLEALKLVEPFPQWSLWGITILLPRNCAMVSVRQLRGPRASLPARWTRTCVNSSMEARSLVDHLSHARNEPSGGKQTGPETTRRPYAAASAAPAASFLPPGRELLIRK